MKNKIKFLIYGIGLTLLVPFIALAVNITVPSAPGAGYGLTSTTTGSYVTKLLSTFGCGLNPCTANYFVSTSTTATSTFAGPIQLSTTTTSQLNGTIVVDGVKYPKTGAGVQQAINDCHNSSSTCSTVYIPKGTYTNATSTLLYSNIHVQCENNAETILTTSANVPVLSTVPSGTSKTVYNDISIKGCLLKGGTGGIARAMFIQGVNGLVIEDNRIESSNPIVGFPAGMHVMYSQNVQITNNYLYNVGGDSIQVNATDDFVVDGNVVASSTDDAIDIDHDFFVGTNSVPSRYGVISNNVVHGVRAGNGIRIENSSSMTITGNVVRDSDTSNCISVNSTNNAPADNANYNIVVTGNTIYNCLLSGIQVTGDNANNKLNHNILISNNVMENVASIGGTDIRAGIEVNASSTTVVGNSIHNSQKSGGDGGAIVIFKATDAVVSDNYIASSTNGIVVWNGSGTETYKNIEINDNHFYGVTNKYTGATTQSGVAITGNLFDSLGDWLGYGIGTSTPFKALTVGGEAYINGTTTSPCFTNTIGGACITSGGSGNSAWTVGNGFIYNATSTDNVGIGSTTPGATLSIKGNGGLDSFYIASSTGGKLFNINPLGYVGIGSLQPTQGLHVSNGAIFEQPDATWSSGDQATVFLGSAGTFLRAIFGGTNTFTSDNPLDLKTTGAASITLTPNNATALTALSGGNIGIATTTPAQKLVVNGGFQLVGGFFDGSAASGTTGQILQSTGTSTKWVTSGGGAGTVTSVDMTVPTGLSISGNPVTTAGTLGLTLTSGYTIPTTVSTGNWDTAFASTTAITPAYIRSLVSATSPVTYNSTTGVIACATCSTLTTNSAWNIGNGFIYNATSTDLVGVGSSTPGSTLTVKGKASINPFTISSPTDVIMAQLLANGNFGIGSSTPTQALHISNGSILVQPDSNWSSADTANLFLGDTGVVLKTTFAGTTFLQSANPIDIRSSGAVDVSLSTNNTTALTAKSGGNVGVGTTTPVANFQATTQSANATTTIEFGKKAQTKGTCIKMYDAAGTAWYYTPVVGTGALTASATACASVTGF